MVITVEPGIYIPEEKLGVRIEDDVLVTETGYKLLTARLPRSAEEVEKVMAEGNKERAAASAKPHQLTPQSYNGGKSKIAPSCVPDDQANISRRSFSLLIECLFIVVIPSRHAKLGRQTAR